MKSVLDKAFARYGRVIDGYDLADVFSVMESTPCKGSVIYEPSCKKLEELPVFSEISAREFGEMPIQVGYCNGTNNKLNALEYHKSSEINIACDDLLLMLGHIWDIENNLYDTKCVEYFKVPKGSMIELFSTTLHYAPCNLTNKFRCIVILPKGTNLPLEKHPQDRFLYAKNKWLLAHEESNIDHAEIALIGENLIVK